MPRGRAAVRTGVGPASGREASMTARSVPPTLRFDDPTGQLHLAGRWTLEHALAIGDLLREAPEGVREVDAREVERLDSVGVLQLLRYARRCSLDFATFAFRPEHHAPPYPAGRRRPNPECAGICGGARKPGTIAGSPGEPQ